MKLPPQSWLATTLYLFQVCFIPLALSFPTERV